MTPVIIYLAGYLLCLTFLMYLDREEYNYHAYIWRETIGTNIVISVIWPLALPFYALVFLVEFIMKQIMGEK